VVQRELERRGFAVAVFANKNLSRNLAKETGFAPVFSLGTYDFPPGNGHWSDLFFMYHESAIYRYELQSTLQKLAPSDFDLIFCHTVSDFELIAWNSFLRWNKLRGHLFMLERLTPRFHSCKRWKLLVHPYWRMKPHYLNAIYRKMRGRFTLLTDSDVLAEDYARAYKHRIVTMPIPIEVSQYSTKQEPSTESIISRYNLRDDGYVSFGYLGDSRPAKGFPLLPGMVQRVLEKDVKLRFIIQCLCNEYESGRVPEAFQALQELSEKHNDRLILVKEKLSAEDYACLFNFIDVQLLPYTDPNFAEGTSNIFAEALALGKPVVVPKETWMSKELKKADCGTTFQRGDVDEFTDEVFQLYEDYENYSTKAQSFRDKWNVFHNPKTLVDILLKESRLEN
jgi:glycosyltransferase involved in cell wall biosynthesis